MGTVVCHGSGRVTVYRQEMELRSVDQQRDLLSAPGGAYEGLGGLEGANSCCSAVRMMLARTAQACAPDLLRLPPVMFRLVQLRGTSKGRVTLGDGSPRVPTDPYVRH